jgi:hypothetical protein
MGFHGNLLWNQNEILSFRNGVPANQRSSECPPIEFGGRNVEDLTPVPKFAAALLILLRQVSYDGLVFRV